MDRILVPGSELVVTGSARVNEGRDNNRYVNVSVRDLSVLKWANKTPAGESGESSAPASGTATDDFVVLEAAAGADLPF